MKTRIMPLLACAALVMPAAALSAEVPQRGQSESQVRSKFGAPMSTKGPVGTPAITRWNYDGFTVYFENGITLHTVKDRPVQQAPDVVSGTDALPPIEEIDQTAAPSAPVTEAPSEPEAAPAASGEMTFDPVSGRFMPAGESAATEASEPATDAAEPAAETSPADTAAGETASTPEPASEPEQAPAPEPSPAPAPAPEPEPEPMPEPEPEPVAEQKAPAPTVPAEPESTPVSDSEFRFDPITGRIIIAGEETPEEAAAKAEADAAIAQAKEEAAKASAEEAAADKAEANAAKAKAAAEDAASEAEEAAEAASDAAEEAADDGEGDGGFYIDWGASQ